MSLKSDFIGLLMCCVGIASVIVYMSVHIVWQGLINKILGEGHLGKNLVYEFARHIWAISVMEGCSQDVQTEIFHTTYFPQEKPPPKKRRKRHMCRGGLGSACVCVCCDYISCLHLSVFSAAISIHEVQWECRGRQECCLRISSISVSLLMVGGAKQP